MEWNFYCLLHVVKGRKTPLLQPQEQLYHIHQTAQGPSEQGIAAFLRRKGRICHSLQETFNSEAQTVWWPLNVTAGSRRSQEGMWSQGENISAFLGWSVRSSLILHAGFPMDGNSKWDTLTWVTLRVCGVTVMENELFVLWAGRGCANCRVWMLEAATKLAHEAMIGFYILKQLLFRGRERGSCSILMIWLL